MKKDSSVMSVSLCWMGSGDACREIEPHWYIEICQDKQQ
jgi:hypothetical protein